MKQKTKIILGLLLVSMSVDTNAQTNVLFSQGFENVQNQDRTSVGWYEFVNTQTGDERDSLCTEEARSGSKSCHFYNVAGIDGNSWDRAIKFRNIPIKDNTSYRVVYYTKGDNNFIKSDGTMSASNLEAALYCGHDASDTQWAGADQSTGFSGKLSSFNTDDGTWTRHAVMGYYANWDWNEVYYLKQIGWKNSKTMPENEFYMSINLYNPGSYFVDDVSVSESTIAGAFFGPDAIKIDFGYANNISSLASSAGGKLKLDKSCVKVLVNGKETGILTVECEPNGCLYIFLDSTVGELTAADDVEISFTNPNNSSQSPILLYTSTLRPRCEKAGDNKAVCDFTNEKAEYDEEVGLDYSSSSYDLPKLVSSNPENGSFDLPTDIKSFSFTFNNEINCGKAIVELKKDNYSEKLTITPSTGNSKIITANRLSDNVLSAGIYTLKISGLVNSKVINSDYSCDTTITVAIGTIAVDAGDTIKSVWKDNFKELGGYVLPSDWTVFDGQTEVTEYYADNCPRTVTFGSGGDMDCAFYIRQGRSSGNGYAAYGQKEGSLLSLKPGNYELTFNTATWYGDTRYIKCDVISPDGTVAASNMSKCSPQLWASQNAINGSTKVVIDFAVNDQNQGKYVIKWMPCGDANGDRSYNGTMFEVLIGKINLEYRPSTPGLYVKNMFKQALDSAKTSLSFNADSKYSGSAYNGLTSVVAQYKDATFTSPTVCLNAITVLRTATLTMNTHRSLVDTYDPLVGIAESVVSSYAGTKYAKDYSYMKLNEYTNIYHGKIISDDSELRLAIDTLTFYTTLCNNMCNNVINDLTARINVGIKTAKILGLTDSNPALAAAEESITDDDSVADRLNGEIRARLYQGIVGDSITFEEKTNPETLETYRDSFDISSFIKNPNLYTIATNNSDMSDGKCPGWKITLGNGYAVSWSVGWGAYDVNNLRPAEDAMLSNWCKSFEINQTVTDLPAGVYSLKVGFGERNMDNPRLLDNYIYAVTFKNDGSVLDSVSMQAPVIGQAFPTDNMVLEGIKVTNGKLKIGALASGDSHVFLNNFSLIMKGKSDTFDYVTSVNDVPDKNSNSLQSIRYYNLDGVRTNKDAKGFKIMILEYGNGLVKVKKQIVK